MGLVVVGLLAATGAVRAGDKVKKDDAGQKNTVIVLDASKLPPELLAQLIKAAGQEGKPAGVKKGDAATERKKGDGQRKARKKADAATLKGQKSNPAPQKNKGEATKVIGLADAIAIAQKANDGKPLRAEWKSDPKPHVEVVIATPKGEATILVSPDGQVISGKEPADKQGDTKNKERKK
jgi:hypothetical protein